MFEVTAPSPCFGDTDLATMQKDPGTKLTSQSLKALLVLAGNTSLHLLHKFSHKQTVRSHLVDIKEVGGGVVDGEL